MNLAVYVDNSPLGKIDPIGLIVAVGGDCPKSFTADLKTLTDMCKASAKKITNEKGRKCVESWCDKGTVRCGNCEECKGKGGFTEVVVGDSSKNDGFITICPDNIAKMPFSIGDILVHEFAHQCGWSGSHPPGSGIPDWPRTKDGKIDWPAACKMYPDYCKKTDKNK